MTEVVLVEVKRSTLDEIEHRKMQGVDEALLRLATEFIEVTSIETRIGERRFTHSLTGKTLVVSAKWLDEEKAT